MITSKFKSQLSLTHEQTVTSNGCGFMSIQISNIYNILEAPFLSCLGAPEKFGFERPAFSIWPRSRRLHCTSWCKIQMRWDSAETQVGPFWWSHVICQKRWPQRRKTHVYTRIVDTCEHRISRCITWCIWPITCHSTVFFIALRPNSRRVSWQVLDLDPWFTRQNIRTASHFYGKTGGSGHV